MSMTSRLVRNAARGGAVVAAIVSLLPGVVFAQTNGQWSATTGGSWPTAANWTSGLVAGGVSGSARFTSSISSLQTVTLDGDRTIGHIRLGSGGSTNVFNLQMGTSGTLTLQTSSGSPSISVDSNRSGAIGLALAGNQGFAKNGAGTLFLGGTSTYAGQTAINAGTLEFTTPESFGASGAGNETVVAGNTPARVRISGTMSTAESFIITGTGLSNVGAINFGSSQAGVLTSSTITGLIQLAAHAQIGAALDCFGWLDRLGTGDAVDNAGFDLSFTGAGTLFVNSPISGAGSFTMNGSGDVYLTAANTYTGTTGWTGAPGKLWLGDGSTGGSLSTASAIDLSNASAVLGVMQTDTVTQGIDFSGAAITGAGQFWQFGSGTTSLNAANSYTGETRVEFGTLLINGAQSAATGAVSVLSNATLGGSGTTGGAVSVLAGGIVAPGSSLGTLTVNNTFSLDNASILSFALNPANATVGGGINDLISGVTDLTLDGVLDVSGAGDWTAVADFTTWRLFNYSGTLTNNVLTLGTMPTLGAGQSFLIDTSTAGQVNLVAVPEPATASLLAGLALGAGLFNWRRRSAARG